MILFVPIDYTNLLFCCKNNLSFTPPSEKKRENFSQSVRKLDGICIFKLLFLESNFQGPMNCIAVKIVDFFTKTKLSNLVNVCIFGSNLFHIKRNLFLDYDMMYIIFTTNVVIRLGNPKK